MNPVEADTWSALKRQAITEVEREPILSGHLHDLVLRHRGYPEALAYLLASCLSNQVFGLGAMVDLIGETIERHPDIATTTLSDLRAIVTRDPAAECALVPFLVSKRQRQGQAFTLIDKLEGAARES